MIKRGFAWIDQKAEHSDADYARAKALAKQWSVLQTQAEDCRFRRMDDEEADCKPELCETCGGDVFLGIDGPRNRRGKLIYAPEWMIGIKCLNPNCKDGYDMGLIHEMERQRTEQNAERALEIELVEDKLERLGARMMRPYEHWHEEERYVEYLETRYDNGEGQASPGPRTSGLGLF
jgi:hypothetical protein